MSLTDSRLANLGATAILDAYTDFRAQFQSITAQAKRRFERRQWAQLHDDAVDRLALYRVGVGEIEAAIRQLLGDRIEDKVIWAGMKAVFSGLIGDRHDWEQAETFFNSVTRRIFSTVGLDEQIEFVDTDFETPPSKAARPIYVTHHRARSTDALIEGVLADYPFAVEYEDRQRDARLVTEHLDEHLKEIGAMPGAERIEMVRPVFYRGKRAYLVGRLFSGLHLVPFVVSLKNTAGGIIVDAVLLDENDVSILFSFTRSYFHVDVERPYDLTRFLRTLMPRKRIAELYLSIGYNKHGKTELYRDLFRHLNRSDEKFDVAPGIPGMVMSAFAMPGYDLLFKLIRDHFKPPKATTRQRIMEKYHLVFTADRAGRLVEANEFEHLEFRRDRFTDRLIEELRTEASQSVEITDEFVVLKHAYVERRVIPLNIYVREASSQAVRDAILDYGNSIKDMAATNIFPGDMLIKNFGVTRHGRVVFYDYDELTTLTACNFRVLPEPVTEEQIMASEPWYTVAENDIFPEEFRIFLGLRGEVREVFEAHHADLYDASYWRAIQKRLRDGEVIHIAPYDDTKRLRPPQRARHHLSDREEAAS